MHEAGAGPPGGDEPGEVAPGGDYAYDARQVELDALTLAGFDQLPAPPGPRRGVVDIQVPLTTLLGLTQLPGELAGWGPVIADIARHVADQQRSATWRFSVYSATGELVHHGVTRRRPVAADTAFIKARDRRCRAPGCRRSARGCDVDHTVDWAHSNDSRRCNLACLCRLHHRFKHESGAELVQLNPGVLGWCTPARMRYVTHPDTYPVELEPPELNDLRHALPPPGD
jgi:hypothetical protein